MTATVATIGSLLEQVARIRPIIEEHSADGEEQRRLADPVYDAMIGAGLFRLTVPKALDGLELHRSRPTGCGRRSLASIPPQGGIWH